MNYSFKEIFAFCFKVGVAIALVKFIITLFGLGLVAALQAIPQ